MYTHRKRWPAFARRWDDVVTLASERIECSLLRSGCNLFSSDPEVPTEVEIAGMSADRALQVLRFYGPGVGASRNRGGRPPRVASNQEVRAALTKAVETFRRRQARERARRGEG